MAHHPTESKDVLELNSWAVVGDHKSNAICARLCSRLGECGKKIDVVDLVISLIFSGKCSNNVFDLEKYKNQ